MTLVVLFADGMHNELRPEPSALDTALWLLGTATALGLFVRALLRGSGALGRGDSG